MHYDKSYLNNTLYVLNFFIYFLIGFFYVTTKYHELQEYLNACKGIKTNFGIFAGNVYVS